MERRVIMKVLFMVILVPIVNSVIRVPRWAQDRTGLLHNKMIRPNLYNVLNPPQEHSISYQYYDESWRKDDRFDDQGDYDEKLDVLGSKVDWNSGDAPPPLYAHTPAQTNAPYPENIWFVFPRAMASKIREFAWHYYNIATRASQKKKRPSKLSETNSKPIAYQYYDESWLRKYDTENKANYNYEDFNYDDFNDDDFFTEFKSYSRSKRTISSPNVEKELNESHASSNYSDKSPRSVNDSQADEEYKSIDKVADVKDNNNVARRRHRHNHDSRQSVTDYLFDTFFGVAEQILAVKHKEREIAKNYLSEDLDVLEILIAQDAKQLSKYLMSKSLLQKIDQIMAVQVGTTLLLKEYKDRNVSRKQFYELVKLAFSNDEQDQLEFLNNLVESIPGSASSQRSDIHYAMPLKYQRKIKQKNIKRTVLDKISESALKNIINHYITVHFVVSKNVFKQLYNEGKITKEELDIDIERLTEQNLPESKKGIRKEIETKLNAEILSAIDYGKQLLVHEYKEGIIPKEKFDQEINHPKKLNMNELKLKILQGLIEQELEKLPEGDETDLHSMFKDMINMYSANIEHRDPNQTKQDVKLIGRVIRNLKK